MKPKLKPMSPVLIALLVVYLTAGIAIVIDLFIWRP
jgi:hypothetical protein